MLGNWRIVSAAALLVQSAHALSNGLALTPQMGWDNWNTFGCDVSEDLLLSTAKTIVDLGLRDLGYQYVILDDCWSAGRDGNKRLIPDPKRFPNGMAHVANAIHALGLKFGMYSSAGAFTCAGFPGSMGYEEIDAQTWADWGVDYLKYDNCYNEGQTGTPLVSFQRYKKMSVALNATGRPILYSICNWGEDSPWKWAPTIANSWRMSGDIGDRFNGEDVRCPCNGEEGLNCVLAGFQCSVMNILNKVAYFTTNGQRSAWNDLDMLEVGNGGMSEAAYKAHFTMWAAVKSPLILGNDVRKMDPSAYSILTNPAIIALSQDSSGSALRRARWYEPEFNGTGTAELQIWTNRLANGDYFVGLLNTGKSARPMNTTMAQIFKDNGGDNSPRAQYTWDLFDLWGSAMPKETAAAILAANSTRVANMTNVPYNATRQSYVDGLNANATILFGTPAGSVPPRGTIKATVAGEGIVAYRMRRRGGNLRRRDEL